MLAYDQLLRKNDMKVTPQRMAIVKELEMHGHLSIDELYEKIIKQFPSISLATLYKNLNSMNESNFTQEVKIPNQKSKYELTKETHSHLVCPKCDKVEDIMIDTSSILKQTKTSHFKDIEVASLILSGICKDCQ